MAGSKRVKIHYRKIRRDNGQFPTETLSTKIASALKSSKDGIVIGDRVQSRISGVPRADGYQRVLNNFHIDQTYVFGDLCLFSPGQMQALLQLSADPSHASLDEVLRAWTIAESRAPVGHEYLHGLAYWMAIGDHFYQIQHVALQTKASEEYLTWLLRDQSGVIGRDQHVELQAEFDRAQLGSDLGDIKSIEIGGLVPETIAAPEPFQETSKAVDYVAHQSLGEKVATGWSKAKRVIVELLGEVEADKLLAQMPSDAALEVTVNIGYRAKRRKFPKEFMKSLASGLRNAPDGELRVRGVDGEIKGDDARLSSDMSVKKFSTDSNLLDIPSVVEQILEVHRRFLHDGKITE
jgi:hypothetical protein